MEIVRAAVDNYRFSDDFRDTKTLIVENTPGIAVISQQRDEITSMLGMRGIAGIIMHPCFVERRCAVAVFVNVHGEEKTAGVIGGSFTAVRRFLRLYLKSARWLQLAVPRLLSESAGLRRETDKN